MGILDRDTRSYLNPCLCSCNSLTWVTRPSHTPVCEPCEHTDLHS
ncbi:hypothetical protein F383_26838 [Gossypium arboreum]|uniref:Uncharacterized protein n=1 Tax=Gossypium arboreum TaxID=29729 RepID=A0A0B0MU82_GOSAR|nr:hypothetical protein F383_26838 [Gossypium arboreum]